ncbi:MAG: glycosyltransferase N-terminal domain-containing protein [Pseudomonadota bacterium]
MARTPSALSVYLIAAGFRPPLQPPESFARHLGDRLWIHVADPKAAGAVPSLVDRLAEVRGVDSDLVMSGHVGTAHELGATALSFPRERASEIRRVMQDEAPSVAVFLGFEMAPACLYGMREAGVRTIVVASPSGTEVRAHGRLLSRSAFRLFDSIAATNEAARTSLIKLGAPAHKTQVVGPLDEVPPAPSGDPVQQERLAQLLSGRPLWLATSLSLTEMRSVLDAQRQANGLSHRLLLVIAPNRADEAGPIAKAAELRGYSVARRLSGQDPEEHIQVLIADDPAELGVWYRLAPITFMGGSLLPPGSDIGPDAPAALGSAIIYGPHIGARRKDFDQLAAVGGARFVETGTALGAAVSSLLSPDKTAAMAHAAWLETSKGAEGTDRVVDILVDAFDDPDGV